MKRKIILVSCLGWLVWLNSGYAMPPEEPKLAAANNAFAFNLLRQIAKEQPAANLFISPYSAATVLQMVANGAVGQTKTEMQQVLATKDLPPDVVNAAAQAAAQSLNSLNNTNLILTTANSIWYQGGRPVNPDFLALNRQFFGSTVEPIDFADPHAVDVINAWAREKTQGRISHVADGMIDPKTARMFLANAVYFKGKWSDPFQPEDTKNRTFHLRGGSQKEIPMMTQSKTFTYRHGTGYQAVRLPYEGEDLAMYVFLPETNSSPEHLLGILNGDRWQRVTKPGFSEKEGTLVLPKFKLEYSVELAPPLRSLGMKMAFDMQQADFSGIAPNLYISAARQKTFVEVKEEGTEAAAVSAMAPATVGFEPPPERFEMIVDRPFVFLIEDNRTGMILFMGVMFDPGTD
jgi:serpin B